MNTKGGGREKKETGRERVGGGEKDCNYKEISVSETLKKTHSGFPRFSDGHGTCQVLHTYYVPGARQRPLNLHHNSTR